MSRVVLRGLALIGFVFCMGEAWAEDAAKPAPSGQCAPGDQLPCNCPEGVFAETWPNPLITPCFTGDVDRQSTGQTEQFGATVFASLNWPLDAAVAESRGLPDYKAGPAGSKDAPNRDFPTVWESWASTRGIFRIDGGPPGTWQDSRAALPAACKGLDLAAAKTEYGWAQVPDGLQPRLLDEFLNPNGQALIDRKGRPVRYEVLFNKQAFDYVADNHLWTPAKLDDFIDLNGRLSFPSGHWDGKADVHTGDLRGAIIVKAAWKLLDKETDNPDHFHKSWAYVMPVVERGKVKYDCKIVPVGLVGLHVIMKTDLFPDWLWITFEHMALAPTWEEVGLTEQGVLPRYAERPAEFEAGHSDASWAWMFYDTQKICSGNDCTLPSKMNFAVPNKIPADPSRIIRMHAPGYYDPNAVIGLSCDEANAARRLDVTASDQAIPPDVGRLNCMLSDGYSDSVFRFYQLKGTQWYDPQSTTVDPSGTKVRKLTPEVLANASMESFNQLDSSCIMCHQTARPAYSTEKSAIFDYIFSFDRDVMARASGTVTGATIPAGN